MKLDILARLRLFPCVDSCRRRLFQRQFAAPVFWRLSVVVKANEIKPNLETQQEDVYEVENRNWVAEVEYKRDLAYSSGLFQLRIKSLWHQAYWQIVSETNQKNHTKNYVFVI